MAHPSQRAALRRPRTLHPNACHPDARLPLPARSTFRLTRELEKYGAASAALAGRESIAYGVEGTKLQAAEITEILLDAVLNIRHVPAI
jgi:hypothetical protein